MIFPERTRRIAQKVAVITLGPLIFFGSVFDAQAQGPNPNRTPPRRPPSAQGLPRLLPIGAEIPVTVSCANGKSSSSPPTQTIINGRTTFSCGELSKEMVDHLVANPPPQQPDRPQQPSRQGPLRGGPQE